jgi:ParB-like chromosome segregation protein Spo0J
MSITASGVEQVSLSKLKPYPNNPRRGDLHVLVESLTTHGQYKPIVVQLSTNLILAGNHTYKAAKQLGWKQIAVTYVDCDDAIAKRIMLADNRMTDLANYDENALLELLEALPDLQGTGFTQNDIDELDKIVQGMTKEDSDDKPKESKPKAQMVIIGKYKFEVMQEVAEAWNEQLAYESDNSKPRAIGIIKERLKLPEPPPAIASEPVEPEVNQPTCDTVPIDLIKPAGINPRQGDVGAITESLKEFGQYRPIVVNKQTMNIVAGNHTWQAAKSLNWTHIAVTYIDVTPMDELKVILIDNRSSDLANYNTNDLRDILATVKLAGTGFNNADLGDIISGGNPNAGKPRVTGRKSLRVLDYSMRVHSSQMIGLLQEVFIWEDIANRLGIPIEGCTIEEMN